MKKLIIIFLPICIISTTKAIQTSAGYTQDNLFDGLNYLLEIMVLDTNAQEIYKSVDEDGNVTYSETPPTETENVDVLETATEPSSEEVEAAQRQIQEVEDELDELANEKNQQPSGQQDDDVTTSISQGQPPVIYGGRPVARHYYNNPHIRQPRRRR